jgi:histidine ammonia-lyase
LRAARAAEDGVDLVRELVPALTQDRVLAPDIAVLADAVAAGRFNVVAMAVA